MGNSNPPPPPPEPINPIMNSIYNVNGTSNILPTVSNHHPSISTVQRVPFKLDSYIDKTKLFLVQISPTSYIIDFVFTSNYPCQISIHYFAVETKEGENTFMVSDNRKYPPPYCLRYPPGANQHYNHAVLDLSIYSPEEIFSYKLIPITIEIFPVYPDPRPVPLHRTYCGISRNKQTLILKVMKQAVSYQGKVQVLMDIYGTAGNNEENVCTICMCEKQNTMILPCRHLCLCNYCAEQLSCQRNKNCPICRNMVTEFVNMTIQ
jgi:Zinc finger, C3HC4 type (RING finger)